MTLTSKILYRAFKNVFLRCLFLHVSVSLEYDTVHEMIHHLLEKTLVEKVHQPMEETCLMRLSLHAPERDEKALFR